MDELKDLRAEMGIYTSEVDHQSLKEKVKRSEPRDIIFHKGDVYVIRPTELRNRSLDYGDEIELMSFNKGLYVPMFFSRSCDQCSNANVDFYEKIFEEMGDSELVIVGNINHLGCSYTPSPKIEVASLAYSNNFKKQKFYALRDDRCAFEDSLIDYVASNELMDDLKVDIPFDFVPIQDVDPNKPIPSRFLLKEVNKFLPKERKKFWFFG